MRHLRIIIFQVKLRISFVEVFLGAKTCSWFSLISQHSSSPLPPLCRALRPSIWQPKPWRSSRGGSTPSTWCGFRGTKNRRPSLMSLSRWASHLCSAAEFKNFNDLDASANVKSSSDRLPLCLQTSSVFFACFREHTFTLTMRNGASGRRRASRLSTGTSKTETSSDVQRDATGRTDNWESERWTEQTNAWRRLIHLLTFLDLTSARWGKETCGPEGGGRVSSLLLTLQIPPYHPQPGSDNPSHSHHLLLSSFYLFISRPFFKKKYFLA